MIAERPALGHGQQIQRRVEGARLHLGRRGRQRPLRPQVGFQRQHRRPLEKRGRSSQPAARLRPVGRALQLGGDVLIGSLGRLGSVPCTPIGIALRVRHLRQGLVHRLSFPNGGRPVHRRTRQRMAESHPEAELGQPRCGRRCGRFGPDAQRRGCPPQQCRIAQWFGRREEQQASGLLGQCLHATAEAFLHRRRQRRGTRQSEPAGQLVNPQTRGNSSNASGLPAVSATI